MKKFSSFLLIISLLSTALFADTSQTYAPLAQSPQFQMRVSWTLAFTVPVILAEPSTGTYTAACHKLRADLAAQVAKNPQSYAPVFATHLSASSNVTTAGALTGSLSAGTLDTPATDAAIFAAVSAEWSTVAGCIINP